MCDGAATTRRAHDVERIECNHPAHVQCYEAVTSWAGQPISHRDGKWHIFVNTSGAICRLGSLVGRETQQQFEDGLRRRVMNKRRESPATSEDGTHGCHP
ncbi:hypothetical protein [Streptomyces noursei]|uniref:Uncharacterized protein n=1 Tax=Streptomyces noursei TaxID=1971 RepID=A0A2N8PQT3_STRNR|nr:hypothetical protein [Streptomyces noursei]PNE43383.1 hypothetical protein AOB60_00085 [Streptomyces noursei]